MVLVVAGILMSVGIPMLEGILVPEDNQLVQPLVEVQYHSGIAVVDRMVEVLVGSACVDVG